MHLVDKSKGVMVGMACGDALGALVEYIPMEFKQHLIDIKTMQMPLPLELLIAEANDELTLNRLQNYINYMSLPGLYTDDTQQAILIAYSLIADKGLNPPQVAKLFVKGARLTGYGDFGIFRHAGPGFLESVSNMMMYKKLDTCGSTSAGNGAAMRIAPLGIFYRDNIDKLLQATIDISLLTHRDIRGIAAAGLISFTTAYVMNKSASNFNPVYLLRDLKDFITELEKLISTDYPTIEFTPETKHQVSSSLNFLEELKGNSYPAALESLDEWAKITSGNTNCLHHSPFALGSVLFSLFLFINYYSDWQEAVLTGVNGGGDSDTIAAMVGAMCGALHGYHNIPSSWADNILNLDTLTLLGESLITLEPLNVDLLKIEKELSKREIDYRNRYRKMLHNRIGFS